MKLLSRYMLIIVPVILIGFITGSILFYDSIQKIFLEELDENLQREMTEVQHHVKIHGFLPDTLHDNSFMHYQPSSVCQDTRYTTSSILIKGEDEEQPFRVLNFCVPLKGNYYNFQLLKPMMETEDVKNSIVTSFILVSIGICLTLVVSTWFFARNIWSNFFTTLGQLNSFNLEKNIPFKAQKTAIREFQKMNETLEKLTSRMSKDYRSMKQFSENASHEMQTPLSIIVHKCELLQHSGSLNEEQFKQINSIIQTAGRLSKLNAALLLLTKIENNQFNSHETINFAALLKNKLEDFSDLSEMKGIRMHVQIKSCEIILHPLLADVLINNLISNAIKYTESGGEINVTLNQSSFSVRNTGNPMKLTGDELFERFSKERPDSESSGLGLSIVQQIARSNNHYIHYEYRENQHIFEYVFKRNDFN